MKKTSSKTKYFLSGLTGFVIMAFFLAPLWSTAQIEPPSIPSIEEQRPESYAEAREYTPQTLINILGQVRDFILIAGIILIIITLAWGGILYATAGGNQEKTEEAKNRLLWALIGAGVILAAFVLITTLIKIIENQSLVLA